MSIELRVELIVMAVLFFGIIIKNVNKGNLQLKYALSWIFAAAVILCISIFPQIAYCFTKWLGIETPSNFIFLLAIIGLTGMNLSLTVIVSKQAEKIKSIVQQVSLYNHENDKKDEVK